MNEIHVYTYIHRNISFEYPTIVKYILFSTVRVKLIKTERLVPVILTLLRF
jgi:hypothetical protein